MDLSLLSYLHPRLGGSFIYFEWLLFSPRCPAGADALFTEDTVSLTFLLLVRSALLAENDVAMPRLVLGVPLLPAERFLTPEALSPVSRCCRPTAGPACGRLAGACGSAAVREQTTPEWIRRPSLHGECLTYFIFITVFGSYLILSPV